jgi:ubiquinone/menaquinone biosynthesis C-methylase UbiE
LAYGRWKSLDQVARYAERRYRKLDQRLLNRREQHLVRNLFDTHEITGPILDIPVGYGRFQSLLHTYGPVHAADWGYYPVLYQRERVGLAVSAVNCAAEALPYRDRTFTAVFCFRLLQHMHRAEEREAMYREFRRVSRQWVVVSLYLAASLHTLHRRLFPKPARITILTREQFTREYRSAGLRLVEMVSVVPGLHAHRICLLAVE